MTLGITIFKPPRWWEEKQKYVYDNKTHRKMEFKDWDEYVSFLYGLSQRKLKGKKDAELISPAVYDAGTTRANKNVLGWAGWAALDIDDHEFEGDIKDVILDRYGHWTFVCYSTASSSKDHPKFRLVFPLTKFVPQESIRHFWFALNSEFGSLGDKQVKDFSRMYYIPADYAGAYNFFFVNSGNPIDVDALQRKWPYDDRKDAKSFLDRLPDEFREQVIAYRKSKLENTDYSWTSYHDCPFWPKKLAAEYMTISSSGWYRQMYRIMIALAGNAIDKKYPLTSNQIVDLCRQFDIETGNWYENRPMEVEANNALEYAYRNMK